MEHYTCRAALCQTEFAFFGQNTVQPGERAAGFTPKRAFGFCGLSSTEDACRYLRGLTVDFEQRENKSSDDVSV